MGDSAPPPFCFRGLSTCPAARSSFFVKGGWSLHQPPAGWSPQQGNINSFSFSPTSILPPFVRPPLPSSSGGSPFPLRGGFRPAFCGLLLSAAPSCVLTASPYLTPFAGHSSALRDNWDFSLFRRPLLLRCVFGPLLACSPSLVLAPRPYRSSWAAPSGSPPMCRFSFALAGLCSALLSLPLTFPLAAWALTAIGDSRDSSLLRRPLVSIHCLIRS